MKTERINWLDISKGIGIILVVWSHALSPDDTIRNMIYQFHMSLFFICSGYCYKTQSYSRFIKSKLTGLYLPLVISTISLQLYYLLQNKITFSTFETRSVKTLLTLYRSDFLGATWFIIVLLYAIILYDLINRVISPKSLKILLICFLFYIGLYIPIPYAPYYAAHALVAQIFLLIGSLLKETAFIEKCFKSSAPVKILILSITLIFLYVSSLFTSVGTSVNQFTHPLIHICISTLGTIGVFIGAHWISKQKSMILINSLKYLGQVSIGIVIWHFLAFKLIIYIQIWALNLDFDLYIVKFPIITEYNNFFWCTLNLIFGIVGSILIQKPFTFIQRTIQSIGLFLIPKKQS